MFLLYTRMKDDLQFTMCYVIIINRISKFDLIELRVISIECLDYMRLLVLMISFE